MTGQHEPTPGLLGRIGGRWTAWRAARDARPEFVKASQARIWRITAVSILAVLGLVAAVAAVLSNGSTVSRLAADEKCLRSVVAAQNDRSSVLSQLGKRRTDADDRRQAWNTVEQRVFQKALNVHSRAGQAQIRREFARANRHFLAADARYRRLNTLYNQAQQAHPVPRLNCTAGHLNRPAPTVTSTTTAHATATRTVRAPRRVRTVIVTRPGRTVIRTVVEPPGKARGRHRGHGR